MKKLLLALVASGVFTIAVANTNTTIDTVDARPDFILQKANSGSINNSDTCVLDCFNTYPMLGRNFERCVAICDGLL